MLIRLKSLFHYEVGNLLFLLEGTAGAFPDLQQEIHKGDSEDLKPSDKQWTVMHLINSY